MKRLILSTLVIGLVLLYVMLHLDFFLAIVPGWHTSIYPLWAIGLVLLLLLLLVLVLIKLIVLFFKGKRNP